MEVFKDIVAMTILTVCGASFTGLMVMSTLMVWKYFWQEFRK